MAGCEGVSWLGGGAGTDPDVVWVDSCPPDGTDATWLNRGKPFVDTWCTGCHSASQVGEVRAGAPSTVNLDTYEDVALWADRIAARSTGPDATMPPAGGPDPVEMAELREWIACGLPGGEEAEPEPCDGAPRVLSGDLTLDEASDVVTFCTTYNTVEGDVLVGALGVAKVDCLCEVQGDLVVADSETLSVVMPALHTVGGEVQVVTNPLMSKLDLGALLNVTGDVRIDDNVLLSELDVNRIEAISGSLVVTQNAALEDVLPERLSDVGGDWVVADNPSLKGVSTDRLTTVGGAFRLQRNPLLGFVYGDTYVLTSVGGELEISENASLGGVFGFEYLLSVGGDINIAANDALLEIFGFRALTDVSGSVRIVDNGALGLINGFEFLEVIPGALEIRNNAQLEYINLDAFRILADVGLAGTASEGTDRVLLEDLPMLSDIGGVGGTLARTPSLEIRRTGLPELDAFKDLVNVASVQLEANDALQFAEVGNSIAVLGSLQVSDNPELLILSGFYGASAPEGDLRFTNNPLLHTIALAPNLSAVGGTVEVQGSDLTEPLFLAPTAEVGGLQLVQNPSLTSLGSLANLSIVGGDLAVDSNNQLTTLDGLDGLQQVLGSLTLHNNASLVSLAALQGLTLVDGDLTVTDNPVCPTQEATDLVDAIGAANISGTVTVSNNGP